jgi:hypothetical protein
LKDWGGGDRFFSGVMLLTILKDSLTSISIIFQRESKVHCTIDCFFRSRQRPHRRCVDPCFDFDMIYFATHAFDYVFKVTVARALSVEYEPRRYFLKCIKHEPYRDMIHGVTLSLPCQVWKYRQGKWKIGTCPHINHVRRRPTASHTSLVRQAQAEATWNRV